MAWVAPKVDWAAVDGVKNTDFNRIEANILDLHTNKADLVGGKVNTSQLATPTCWIATVVSSADGWNQALTIPGFVFSEGCQVTFKTVQIPTDTTPDGNRITINGGEQFVFITLSKGYVVSDTWAIGTQITVTLSHDRPTGWGASTCYTAFFKGGAAAGASVNVYVQPTAPVGKDGVWIYNATALKPKKIVFDGNPYTAYTWVDGSGIAKPSTLLRMGQVISYNNKLYSVSGYTGGSSLLGLVFQYDPLTNVYTQMMASSPAFSKTGINPAIVNGVMYTFAGQTSTNAYVTTAYKWDFTSNAPVAIANYPSAFGGIMTAVYNGLVYLFGGFNSSAAQKASRYYNPATNTYTSISAAPVNMSNEGSSWAIGSNLYLISYTTAYVYHADTDTYTAATTAPAYATHSILVGNKIFFHYYLSLTSYDPATNTYGTVYTTTSSVMGFGQAGNFLYGLWGDDQAGSYATPSPVKMALTPKQYDDDPTVVFYWLKNDATRSASLSTSKTCPVLPVGFKDVLFFTGANLTYPSYYIGDGTNWNKIR